MPAISVSNPAGYILAVHEFKNIPRRAVHTTIGGGAVGTHHGFEHRRWLVCKFITEDEIESVIRSYETDGYYRAEEYTPTYSVHDQVKLYDFSITLVKFTASEI